MKVIALISQKGGVGKTTLTGHLAVEAEAAGDGPVVLLDTDPQGSLAAWWNAREAEAPAFANAQLSALPEQIASLEKAGYAYAFVDTPPAMTREIAAVVAQADLVVIPVKPSPHDLRAVGSTVELVEEAGKPFLFVVGCEPPHGAKHRGALGPWAGRPGDPRGSRRFRRLHGGWPDRSGTGRQEPERRRDDSIVADRAGPYRSSCPHESTKYVKHEITYA